MEEHNGGAQARREDPVSTLSQPWSVEDATLEGVCNHTPGFTKQRDRVLLTHTAQVKHKFRVPPFTHPSNAFPWAGATGSPPLGIDWLITSYTRLPDDGT